MNERIRELALQVGAGTPQSLYGRTDYIVMTEFELEKFVKLIVRECAFVAQNKDDTNINLRYGRGLAAGKILEHFGVEE